MRRDIIEEPRIARFVFADTRMAWFWLLVRLYLGYGWILAASEKIMNPAWTGSDAGSTLKAFVDSSLTQTAGPHPNVQWWYADFLRTYVLPHLDFWAHLVAWGELLVGIALIAGFLVGIATFFGMFMNFNYMLAGAVSVNPIWFTIGIGLILAWRIAGYIGLDYYVLPRFRPFFRIRHSSS